jgi:hypothetical protein
LQPGRPAARKWSAAFVRTKVTCRVPKRALADDDHKLIGKTPKD